MEPRTKCNQPIILSPLILEWFTTQPPRMHLEFLKDNAIPATGSSLPSRVLPLPSPESLPSPSPTQLEIIPRLSHHIDLSSSSFRPGFVVVVISTSFFSVSCLAFVICSSDQVSLAKIYNHRVFSTILFQRPISRLFPGTRGLGTASCSIDFLPVFPGTKEWR